MASYIAIVHGDVQIIEDQSPIATQTNHTAIPLRLLQDAWENYAVIDDDSLALFVGREEYEQAGGFIQEEAENDYFLDPLLLVQLAYTKLEEEAESLRKAGWSDLEFSLETPSNFYFISDNIQSIYSSYSCFYCDSCLSINENGEVIFTATVKRKK